MVSREARKLCMFLYGARRLTAAEMIGFAGAAQYERSGATQTMRPALRRLSSENSTVQGCIDARLRRFDLAILNV
jgi:hypothetical protein